MKCGRCDLIYERALASYGPRETLYWAGQLYGQWETRVARVLALVVAKENEFKLGDAQIVLHFARC